MNLIITCQRNLEELTISEIQNILERLGDTDAVIEKTMFSGIIQIKTKLNNMKVLDLGRNGSIVVFLESSQIPAPSSSVVINTLPTIYSNLKNVDSRVSYKGWLNQAQTDMTVKRHSDRLASSNTTE